MYQSLLPLKAGLARQSRPVRSRLRLERGGNGFIDSFEPNKFELFARLFGDILEVLPVPRRKHDALDAGPMSRNNLLLDPADREHETAQADLAGHRRIIAHGAFRHQ